MAHIISNLMFFMIFLDKPSLPGHDGNEVNQKVRDHWHLCLHPLNTGIINGLQFLKKSYISKAFMTMEQMSGKNAKPGPKYKLTGRMHKFI